MLALIPVLVEGGNITVVIAPFKSLITNYQCKLGNMKIPFEHYTGAEDSVVTGDHGLILVSGDMARTSQWRQTITKIHQSRPVQRLVYDEGHCAITAEDFCQVMRDIEEVRCLPVQVVVLSATVPPQSEPTLATAFGLASDYLTFRMSTNRPELEYIIKPGVKSSEATVDQTVALVKEEIKSFSPQDRALVFASFKASEGIPIAEKLGCNFYHGGSDLGNAARETMYQKWITGKDRVMVCTNAFGAGNDYAHVRLVVHAGTPKHVINYVQEVGRAGRDGKHA
ncbi:hypothetical protein C0991_001805, partial [Blastosporella zonata]